jgi:cytoskeleton protein RodZ
MTQVTRLSLDEDGSLSRRRIHLREISGDLDAPLETVGQDLRAARLKRGEDLSAASRALKIRKEHLEALEEDKIEALPGRTYAVGFVRSYADYLGLDPVLYVERFKAEIAGRNDMAAPPVHVIDEDDHRKLPHGWWAIAGVVMILVLYGAYQLMAAADRAMHESVNDPPPIEAPAPLPVPPKQAVVTPPPPASAPGQQPPQSAAVQAVTPGLMQTSPDAVRPALNSTSALTAAPAQQPVAPPPQGQVYGDQSHTARVVLRAMQPTRILVEGPDGRVFMNRSLKAGDVYMVPNMVGLKLTASDAGAIEISLDGQAIGRAGRKDETAEAVALDPQAIMDRYNR